ncbi:isocitrate dehydrogenase [Salinibacter sp. 10B]|uniref:isocitrate/isopropylmalate dehydrogenase family protein n=1 Tax=Salinibacter sp. 10B TaxID=1923971 RepID=UPI000CF3EB20|nr:isocitrate/isopropylmalate family dehydrogenase [Salinibacter sp. 10B]PQJ34195.1 isocitrate dehydrogenase [Salinibacter sp. 10B]
MSHTITLLPGDGIGPEVTEATVQVIEAAGVDVSWDRHRIIGQTAVERGRPALPPDIIDSIQSTGIALKGPVTTPVGQGFTSVNVQLRQRLDLYANVRPCAALPGIETPFDETDLIIFRENTEGLYSGIEHYDERLEIADSIARVTKRGSERIIRFCFEYAKQHGREHVTLAHKANILKKSSGLFLDVGREVAAEYPGITFDDRIIDALCMDLVMHPEEYDCIVSTNLFGDILSDLAAGLVGGLGVTAGANIGDDYAVFEAVHGSAPDIAGQNIANPTALIQSAIMMLRHLEETAAANAIEEAVLALYEEGAPLTPDVGGDASTSEFADALADRVASRVGA